MKVSIITVCFNSEKTIENTILSVIGQSYRNIEYIIIDGGSTDDTIKIINKYSNFIAKFISEKDDGIYNAINKGIKLASGDLISILHSDDFYLNDRILQQVTNIFQDNSSLDCLIGTTIMRSKLDNRDIRKYSPKNFKNWMLFLGVSPPHPSLFLKSKIYKKYGVYKETLKIASDFDFYLRILFKIKIKYKTIDDTLVAMRYGGTSTKSFKSNFLSSKEILKSFKENGIYNNWLIILLRFPFKIFQFFFKK